MIKLGTRASPLALWQAHHIRDLLQADDPSLEVEIVEIRSDGELYPDQDFRSIGVGVFTRAIDLATRKLPLENGETVRGLIDGFKKIKTIESSLSFTTDP